MNTPRLFALCVTAGALVATSAASGQSLSDRIDHVMQQRTAAQKNNNSRAALLGALLYTDVSVQFQETPARDALKYLETVLGVTIVGRFSDDKTGEGIDPDAPITLNSSDRPAITVLEMMLDQVGDGDQSCTWQLRDGFIEVGTKERLGSANAREIRFYPIKDMLFEPPMFDNAPSLDLDSALNQGTGGQGGGSGGGGGGGRGGGGGSGGGGSGGGGGGSIFGEAGDEGERPTEAEQAQQIMDLITETVEPEAWETNGGEFATIRYYQGTLIIRAPDFIHRQIGGYPFAARSGAPRAMASTGGRYVTFTGGVSNVTLTDLKVSEPVGGSTGGGGSPSTGGSKP